MMAHAASPVTTTIPATATATATAPPLPSPPPSAATHTAELGVVSRWPASDNVYRDAGLLLLDASLRDVAPAGISHHQPAHITAVTLVLGDTPPGSSKHWFLVVITLPSHAHGAATVAATAPLPVTPTIVGMPQTVVLATPVVLRRGQRVGVANAAGGVCVAVDLADSAPTQWVWRLPVAAMPQQGGWVTGKQLPALHSLRRKRHVGIRVKVAWGKHQGVGKTASSTSSATMAQLMTTTPVPYPATAAVTHTASPQWRAEAVTAHTAPTTASTTTTTSTATTTTATTTTASTTPSTSTSSTALDPFPTRMLGLSAWPPMSAVYRDAQLLLLGDRVPALPPSMAHSREWRVDEVHLQLGDKPPGEAKHWHLIVCDVGAKQKQQQQQLQQPRTGVLVHRSPLPINTTTIGIPQAVRLPQPVRVAPGQLVGVVNDAGGLCIALQSLGDAARESPLSQQWVCRTWLAPSQGKAAAGLSLDLSSMRVPRCVALRCRLSSCAVATGGASCDEAYSAPSRLGVARHSPYSAAGAGGGGGAGGGAGAGGGGGGAGGVSSVRVIELEALTKLVEIGRGAYGNVYQCEVSGCCTAFLCCCVASVLIPCVMACMAASVQCSSCGCQSAEDFSCFH